MTEPTVPVVLLTGCSSGIGREAARRFGRRGWRVFASMRRPERPEGRSLREEAGREGWALETPHLDVADGETVTSVVEEMLRSTEGTVDAVVANAGYILSGPLEEVPADALREHLDVLVVGVHRVVCAVLPAMRRRGSGRVVVVSSLAGRTASPVLGAYNAAKFAVEGMAEAWRYELAPFGIDVAVIAPGPFLTEIHRNERRCTAPGSPYAAIVDAYDGYAGKVRRGDAGVVAEAIVGAATGPRPSFRRALGPLSFLSARIAPIVPFSIREWYLGKALKLDRLPRP